MRRLRRIIRIFSVLAALMASSAAFAKDFKSVKIVTLAGEYTLVDLAGSLHLSFADGALIVTDGGDSRLTFPVGDLLGIAFSEEKSGIEAAQSLPGVTIENCRGGNIAVAGLQAGNAVAIYDLAGRCLVLGTADAHGRFAATVSGDAGVLIVCPAGGEPLKTVR